MQKRIFFISVLISVFFLFTIEPVIALAVRAGTASDEDGNVVEDENIDTTDLANKVINVSIPSAIVIGSSYAAITKGIGYYSQKQNQLDSENRKIHALNERRGLYKDFLTIISGELDYQSGTLKIVNPNMLSNKLHKWHQLAVLDLPSNMDVLFTEFLEILDNTIKTRDQKSFQDNNPTNDDYSKLEKKLKELIDSMRKDIQE